MLKARVSLFLCLCFACDTAADKEVLAEPETRIVDVIVPYTVRFLNTVSGRNVTVASLLAVRSNTSVVWISSHFLHCTLAAKFPDVGLTSLGFAEGLFWRLEWGCCPTLLFWSSFETAAEEGAEEPEAESVLFLTPTNPVGASTHLVVLLVKNLVLTTVLVVVSCSQCVLVPNFVIVT